MKVWKSTVLGAIALVGTSMTANATLTIDDFTTGSQSISLGPAAAGTSTSSNDVAATNTIGGYRDIKITLDATNGVSAALSADTNPPAGVMSFSAKSGNSGTLLLTYDGLAGAGLGNTDLTEGGASSGITIDFVTADAGSSMTIDVIDGGTTASRTLPSAGPGALFFDFAGFSNPSALASADVVKVTIVGHVDGDYTIDQITTRTPGNPGVPEPVTAGLGLMGLSALSLAATRRRKA